MITIAVLFFSALLLGSGQVHVTTESAYLNGLTELDAGHPDRAVAIWMQGWNELDSEGLVDPRIGFSVIETVTRYEMSHLYEQAAHIYLWGFQATDIEPWAKEYQAELDRLRPLVHPDQFELWQQLLDDRDPLLFGQLRSFWLSLDPMPSTEYNPRIVEHWERIGYAREHFTLNDRSPYGTDERGLIYVKYGSPDIIEFDTFRLEMSKVRNLARLSVPESLIGFQYFVTARNRANAVEIISSRLFRESRYEVWKYDISGQELVFFFGRPEGNGPFQLLDSILDLLPNRYNSMNTAYGLRINVAPMLITSAFDQGSRYDEYYLSESLNMYAMFDLVGTPGNRFTWNPFIYNDIHFRVVANAIHRRNQADDQVSWLNRNLPELQLESHTWRFLDSDNNPYTVSATFSTLPEMEFFHDPDHQQVFLRNSRITSDVQSNVLCRNADIHHINQENLPLINQQNNTLVSLITCPQTGDEDHSIITAELLDLGSASTPDYLIRPPSLQTLSGLIALGRSDIELKEPLTSEPNHFTSSDLVLGLSSGEIGTDLSDLRLTPQNRFPLGEDIVLFFEVYNLSTGSGPFREYTMDYEIHPIRTRLQRFLGLGQLDRDQSITLTFETQNSRSTQQMELELAGVTEGEYELIITFTDVNSGQTVQRVTQFILEDL